jgi:hypothetical protein
MLAAGVACAGVVLSLFGKCLVCVLRIRQATRAWVSAHLPSKNGHAGLHCCSWEGAVLIWQSCWQLCASIVPHVGAATSLPHGSS